MEEPGNLEIEMSGLTAAPKDGNQFLSGVTEFEYGAKGWWTTEFYLDGQTTANESTIFTGFRWENRFRLLMHDHLVNPVFYVEYEDTNGADKSLVEVVGFDSQYDGLVPNQIASRDRQRELETKLILSSNLNGWNIAENFIAEKNLAGEPWEFGYAAAVSRPLSLLASADECTLCRENFQAGVEFFGGLGTANKFTVHGTSQYIAPVLSWQVGECFVQAVADVWFDRRQLPGNVAIRSAIRNQRIPPQGREAVSLMLPCKMHKGGIRDSTLTHHR